MPRSVNIHVAHSIASPYRINAAPNVVRDRRRHVDTKRATFASGIPLGVMALAFFLPAAQDCSGTVIAPVDEAMKSVGGFAWLAPTYLGAALFFAAIVHLWVTRRSSSVVPIAAIAINATAAAFMMVASTKSWPFYAPALLALPLLVIAWRRNGVLRLSFMLDAFVLFTIPVVVINVDLGRYWGAYAFIAAYAMLVTIRLSHAWTLFQARWAQITSNG